MSSRGRFSRLRAALPKDRLVARVESWPDAENRAGEGHCLVACIPWLPSSPDLLHLTAFKRRHPRFPVVLVTRWDSESARHLKDIFVEEVVWLREVGRDLGPAVRQVCSRHFNYVRCLAVSGGISFAALEASSRTCALNREGRAYCWGFSEGEFPPFEHFEETGCATYFVRTGSTHACGVTVLREVWCWGSNAGGELGRPQELGDSNVPVRVKLPFGGPGGRTIDSLRRTQ